jgi:hypothetical protein
MGHFIKAASTAAKPTGCFAFDESSLRCRGRTKAKSYSPHKKDKFAIRLYTLVCSKFAYIYSFWDGAHGKRYQNAPGAEGFCNMFKVMRSYYERAYPQSDLMKEDLSSSLWVMMMAMPVRLDKSQANKRTYYTDSYYTRHALAKALLEITDGRAFITGTMKLNYMIKEDRVRVKEVVDAMNKDSKRGDWMLLQVYERDKNNIVRVATNCGYICIKDTRVVTMYSNDLADTPNAEVVLGTSEHAIHCVRGLATIYRWTSDEFMKKTPVLVPALFAAYNLYMNGVDRVDQYRATAPVRRRERRINAIIYSYIIDCSIHNAYAFSKVLGDEKRSYYQFKIDLALTLMSAKSTNKFEFCVRGTGEEETEVQHVDPILPTLRMNEATANFCNARRQFAHLASNIVAGAGSDDNTHVLVDTIAKSYVYCFVCSFMDVKRAGRTCSTCTGCQKGFHTGCFALFHNSIVSSMNPMVLQTFFQRMLSTKCLSTLALATHSFTPDINVPMVPRCFLAAKANNDDVNVI